MRQFFVHPENQNTEKCQFQGVFVSRDATRDQTPVLSFKRAASRSAAPGPRAPRPAGDVVRRTYSARLPCAFVCAAARVPRAALRTNWAGPCTARRVTRRATGSRRGRQTRRCVCAAAMARGPGKERNASFFSRRTKYSGLWRRWRSRMLAGPRASWPRARVSV
ncbi:LAQU0S01e12486g1_1 [Lachancea quebecensis]|uniref:LAQU0S01e12486g1_1 n=1 Tax=Lachancea quebecensis TaxID=1654605 RepID=A0A0P1KLT4_9SACH|nr:LAQU0S01e12486g1_1 [Lachancea quebecensis]